MDDEIYPQILKDRYRLRQRIGEGGMGVVYVCEDMQSGARHAVKFLSMEQVLSKGGLQRFTHEARLLSHLSHPNIVHIYDYGVEEGLPYLVMELCLGRDQLPYTLKELQEEKAERRLSKALLLDLIPQMLAAVSLLHERGLVHRDLKPENFLLRTTPDDVLTLKLSDFGLVALTGDEELQRRFELSISVSMQDSVVKDRAWVGTYAFMSPEQKQGLQLDARSDVYSLGLILYRLCTGYERLNPELPTEVNPELPEWLDTLVERAVCEDREQRWLTAGKMVEYLPDAYRIDTRPPRQSRRQARWVLPGAAALLLILIALYRLLISSPGMPQEEMPQLPEDERARQTAFAPVANPVNVPVGGQSGTVPPLVVELLEQISTDAPPERAAARARLQSLAPNVLAHLSDVLRHGDDEARRQAALALGYLDDEAAAVPLLTALYDGPEPVRRATAEAFAQLGEKALAEMTEALMSHDPNARGYALYALSRTGAPAAPAWTHALGSPIDSIRDYASEVLVRLGPASVPPLIDTLAAPQPETRQLAVDTLVKLGEATAAPALLQALRRDEAIVRAGALEALGKLQHVDAALKMTDLFRDSDPAVREAARNALITLGEPAAAALLRVFRESGPAASEYAATALSSIGEPALGILMQAFVAEGPAVRRRVTQVLTRIGDPAVPQLLEVLYVGPGDVRRDAALALASMHSGEALRSLLRAVSSDETEVRANAGDGLNALDISAVPDLIALLDDGDRQIYRNSQKLLIRLGPRAQEHLVAALDAPEPIVRVRLAEVLVTLQAQETFPAIIRALDDQRLVEAMARDLAAASTSLRVEHHLGLLERLPAEDVRRRLEGIISRFGREAAPLLLQHLGSPRSAPPHPAAQLLAAYRDPLYIPPLVRALRCDDLRFPELNIAAAEALGRLQHPAAVPPLCQSLLWNDARLRTAAMEALGRIAHPSSIDTLIRALDDRESEVRSAAAEALGAVGSPRALEPLRAAISDPNPTTSAQAIQAIRRIQQRQSNP